MEFKHQMIGSTLLYKYHDPVFNDIGIINFKRNLAILIDKYPVKDIILDVENTKIIDNNGLSAIMFARRFTNAHGQNCVLGMPRPKLLSLLKTSKLTPSFKIIQRKEEYQAYLKTLVEEADKERSKREAEKAKRAEESKKAEEARKLRNQEASKEAPKEEKNEKQAQNEKMNTPRKPKRRVIKKKEA
jgi:anti-anti-sigma regulatory factor